METKASSCKVNLMDTALTPPLLLQVFLLIKAPEQAHNTSSYCSRCHLLSIATLVVLSAGTWCPTDQSDCSHSLQWLPAESTWNQKGYSKYFPSALTSWYFWMHCDYYLTLMHFSFKPVTYF